MSILAFIPEWLQTLAGVSTGTVAVAWCATFALRRQAAALRHLVWLLALCAPLVALPLKWVSPRVAIPVLARAPGRAVSSGSLPELPAVLRSSEPGQMNLIPSGSPSMPAAAPTLLTRLRLPADPWFGVWLAGMVFLGLRLAARHWRLRRLVHDTGAPGPADLLRLLHGTKRIFRCTRQVVLLVGPLTEVPFCHGIFRPVIHFPESWRGWGEERIQMCLAHELVHVIRGDLPMMLVGQWVCMVCWFNPLVWLAAARMRGEAERAADDRVLAGNVAPVAYAASLVAIAERCRASVLPVADVAFAMARPHRLRARIDAILDPTLRRRPPDRVAVAGISALALAVLTAATTVRLTAAPANPANVDQKVDLSTLDSKARDVIETTVDAAIKAGDIRTVDSLLQRGLGANAVLDDSHSFLFEAVDNHQFEIVKLLLARGADVNRRTSWGDTPIKRACWRGYQDIANALVQAGSPVDALQYATGMGNVAGLETIDKTKAITAKDARSALYFAVASGHESTFDWLWARIGSMDDTQRDKLLGDLFENGGKWGQPSILRHLHDLGASTAKYGRRALESAVAWNYVETARYLLELGVSPKPLPPDHANLLLRSPAGEGHLEMVRLLLDHGADINAGDPSSYTPLSWAAHEGREDVCLLLLERGADAGIEDENGTNAAWHAAGGEHCLKALEVMLTKGVKVTGKDKEGRSILNFIMSFLPPQLGEISAHGRVYSASEVEACEMREQRVVERLAAAGADCKGQEGSETPLMNALDTGHAGGARTLRRLGADFSTKDKDGNNALYYLLAHRWDGPLPVDLLKDFLTHGGDPNFEAHFPGSRPPVSCPILTLTLTNAVRSGPDQDGFQQAVEMLIAHGARFARVADKTAQALLQAAVAGSLPRIQEAIQQGAPVNVADDSGWDALTVAVALDHIDCVNWLLANGAVPSSREVKPWFTLLEFAIDHDRAELVDALIAKGVKATGSEGLRTAIEKGSLRIFDALLKAGADPKSVGNATEELHGKTYTLHGSVLLYVCIDHGQAAMAKTLLDRGADPDPIDLDGGDCLAYYAVADHQPQILQALLDHGAEPSRKNQFGESPLSLARKSYPDLLPMLEAALTRAQEVEARERAALQQKVETLIIPRVEFRATPFAEAIESLRQEAARLCAADSDPNQRGINIFIKRSTPPKSPGGMDQGANGASPAPITSPAGETVTLNLDHRPLLEILRGVAGQVNLKVTVEQYAVSLVPLTESTERFITVRFAVAPETLGVKTSPDASDPAPPRINSRPWLEAKGITFPAGASATYLPESQKLVVRDTAENIDRLKAPFPPSALLK